MKAQPFVRYFGIFAVAASLLQSCAFFAGKPPLPKNASIEHLEKPAATTDYNAVVESADIIYFPVERVGFGAKTEPAALLIEALEKGARPFALGWDLIDDGQQPLLDSWQTLDAAARRQAIGQLELFGSGRAREHFRSILRELRSANVSHLALRSPADTSALGLVRREFAAERIVRYLRRAGAGAKALIFLREADLDSEQGVPNYVAQKMEVRQLVFGSDSLKKQRSQLLTKLLHRRLQVVDCAPTTRDN